mmetsp:Transcript_27328/g.40629  ORF Transcript_27328/g.40629 Transcript_27328/m.40629 type:complete len:80 (+) Transcript_27328:682-921(+)
MLYAENTNGALSVAHPLAPAPADYSAPAPTPQPASVPALCFGKEDSVISQLDTIVSPQNFDVDMCKCIKDIFDVPPFFF